MTTQKGFQFKVGQLAKHPSWDVDRKEVLFIGNEKVFYRWVGSLAGEAADPFSCWDDYVLYTPPKKTIRMALAIFKAGGVGPNEIGPYLFENEDQAYQYYTERFCKFIQWPLTINGVEQWVDVPVEDK